MLKKLKYGEEMPKDFWNYNVNPILGYEYRTRRNFEKEAKKYEIKQLI